MDAENEQGETKEAQEAHLLDLYNSALQVFPNCVYPQFEVRRVDLSTDYNSNLDRAFQSTP